MAATKLGQGNVFTGVCDSVHRGGGLRQGDLPLAGRPPRQGDPPGRENPPPAGRIPSGKETPPPGRPPPAGRPPLPIIRSMSGRYASYWNAFLFFGMSARSDICTPTFNKKKSAEGDNCGYYSECDEAHQWY